MKSRKRRWCWYCRFAGKPFKVVGDTHVHCEHPDPDVAYGPGQHDRKLPFSGFDSVRKLWETCPSFDPKQKASV